MREPIEKNPGARYYDSEVPEVYESSRAPDTRGTHVRTREEKAVKFALDAYVSLFASDGIHRRELESLLNEYLRIVRL